MAMPKKIKIPFLIIFGLVLLLVVAVLLTQTPQFKNWLAGYVEDLANESLSARISIGRLEGNLFTNMTLRDVALTQATDTVFFSPRIHAEYDPIEFLYSNIHVEQLVIDSPFIHAVEDADGWNLANLTSTEPSAEGDTTEASGNGALGYDVYLDELRLVDGRVRVMSANASIPDRIDSLKLVLSGEYTDDTWTVDLRDFRFAARSPDLTLSTLALHAQQDDGVITLDSLVLATAANRIAASGWYAEPDSGRSTLSTAPLQLSEFGSLVELPDIQVEPRIAINLGYRQDSLDASIALTTPDQAIDITADIGNVRALIDDEADGSLSYVISLALDNVDLAPWSGAEEPTTKLSGTINIEGERITPDSIVASIDARFPAPMIYGYQIDSLRTSVRYNRGTANVDLNSRAPFGNIRLAAELSEILASPKYSATARVTQCDLKAISGDAAPKTDLNLQLEVNGRGFNPDSLVTSMRLSAGPSRVESIAIDTLFADLHIDNDRVRVDTLEVVTGLVEVDAGGEIGLDESGDLTFAIEINDLSSLREYLGDDTGSTASADGATIDSIDVAGVITGNVVGRLDSLYATLDLDLKQLVYADMSVESVTGSVNGALIEDSLNTEADIVARSLAYADIRLDSVLAQVDLEPESINVGATVVYNDSISGILDARYDMGKIPVITIADLRFNLPSDEWSSGGDSIRVELGPDWYRIDNFGLMSTIASDSVQSLEIDGVFRQRGAEDLRIRLQSLYLDRLASMIPDLPQVSGVLDGSIDLTGTTEDPELDIDLAVTDGGYGDFENFRLDGSVDYRTDTLSADLRLLLPGGPDSLIITGRMPVDLTVTDPAAAFTDDVPVQASIAAADFPLTLLTAGAAEDMDIYGTFTMQVNVGNTLGDPAFSGSLRTDSAALAMPLYGLNYRHITLASSFSDNQLSLDSLSVKSGDGYLRANGTVELGESLMSGTVSRLDFSMNANKFRAVRHRHYEAVISGRAGITGNQDGAEFSGDMTINRSSWYLPALTGEATTTDNRDVPMLVQA
ncbi:hypothetical protein GF377_11090, partial [candidate division GN15 bacterium]|nr:hypothetical protein [candidate division GN15 bacterium]